MIESHAGELAALMTAVFWTVTALAFEAASKEIGALTVNLLRLYIAFGIYSIVLFFTRGLAFPTDADQETWFWLILSGLVGFVIGDQFLFQAYVVVGARISMLIMSLVPPITAIVSWFIMGEKLTAMNITGMILTVSGVSMVVLKRGSGKKNGIRNSLRFSYPAWGILLAFLGATGQAVGLVLSKYGMKDYNAFAASQIRVLAGLAGFTIMFVFLRRWRHVAGSFKNKKGMKNLVTGSVFGPFLGVSFSLLAVQLTKTGVAATIMAIVPVLIIPPAIILQKEKIGIREIFGAIVAVGGVALLFLF